MRDMEGGSDGPDSSRLMELIAVVAMTVLVVMGLHYFNQPPRQNAQTSFIVPSENARW